MNGYKTIGLILIILYVILPGPAVLAADLTLTGPINGVQEGDNITTQGTCTIDNGSSVTLKPILVTRFTGGFTIYNGGSLSVVNIDNDGLSNAWELQYFGHLDYGPDDDPDGDLLTNAQEFESGNNPVDADLILTGDIDGLYESTGNIKTINTCTVQDTAHATLKTYFSVVLRPGFSVKTGGRLTVINVDNDGLANHCEILYFGHLNYGPEDDIDYDKLTNFQECLFGYNPAEFDLDNDDDGLEDWWEIQYFGLTMEYEGYDDNDGDGVLNKYEFLFGANPILNDLPGPGIHYEYDALGRIKQIYRIPAE